MNALIIRGAFFLRLEPLRRGFSGKVLKTALYIMHSGGLEILPCFGYNFSGEGRFFREVLPDEPVRVFAKAPFPRVIGMRKENVDRERMR
jgi:hypothetical protein